MYPSQLQLTLWWAGSLMWLGAGPLLRAQTPPTASAAVDSVTDIAQWATVTTDTGDMAPGHHDWSHYTDLRLCTAAANNELDYQRRTSGAQYTADSLRRLAPTRDTLPASVSVVARACGARFSAATQTSDGKQLLLQLQLLGNQDNLAATTVTAILKQIPLTNRPDSIIQIMHRYLQAEPARVAAAETLLTQLEMDRTVDRATRMDAHETLMAFGFAAADTALFHHESDAIYTLGQDATIQELQEGGGYNLQEAMKDQLFDASIRHGDSVVAVAHRWYQFLLRPTVLQFAQTLKPTSGLGSFLRAIPEHSFDWFLAQVTALSVLRPDTSEGHLHPLQAQYWFPIGHDTLRPPQTGEVSLVIGMPVFCTSDFESLLFDEDCENYMRTVRMYSDLFAAAGLHMVLVTFTRNHSLLSDPQTSLAEAKNLEWYVHDYWHVSATLAVQETPFLQQPTPVSMWEVDTANAVYRRNTQTREDIYRSGSVVELYNAFWYLIDADGSYTSDFIGDFSKLPMIDLVSFLLARQHQHSLSVPTSKSGAQPLPLPPVHISSPSVGILQ